MPAHGDEVRPLATPFGPRAPSPAHRLAVVLLFLIGIVLLPIRPILAGIILVMGLTLVLDRRGIFGRGMFRAAIAFIAGLWLGLAGVVGTLLGMVPLPASCDTPTTSCEAPESNFLFAPGVLLLVLGLGLLGWAVASLLLARRRRPWPTEVLD